MPLVELVALLLPICTYFFSLQVDMADPVALSLFEATTMSLSGLLLWLHSRFLASRYLIERQRRKQEYTESILHRSRATSSTSKQFGDAGEPATGARLGEWDHSDHTMDSIHASSIGSAKKETPRTVARLSPVKPALLACIFFLASIGCIFVAVIVAILQVQAIQK